MPVYLREGLHLRTCRAACGNRRWSRWSACAACQPDPETIPCHRVVNRFGELSRAFAFGGENRQKELLDAEGVPFLPDGRVDLRACMWWGD